MNIRTKHWTSNGEADKDKGRIDETGEREYDKEEKV